jgi:hypothetical protein
VTCDGLDCVGREEEVVARHAVHAQVPAGVVWQRHGQVNALVVVLLDSFDDGQATVQGEIEDVSTWMRGGDARWNPGALQRHEP